MNLLEVREITGRAFRLDVRDIKIREHKAFNLPIIKRPVKIAAIWNRHLYLITHYEEGNLLYCFDCRLQKRWSQRIPEAKGLSVNEREVYVEGAKFAYSYAHENGQELMGGHRIGAHIPRFGGWGDVLVRGSYMCAVEAFASGNATDLILTLRLSSLEISRTRVPNHYSIFASMGSYVLFHPTPGVLQAATGFFIGDFSDGTAKAVHEKKIFGTPYLFTEQFLIYQDSRDTEMKFVDYTGDFCG